MSISWEGSGSRITFHYVPGPLRSGCNDSWGTFGPINVDQGYNRRGYHAQYFASQLLTRDWVMPGDAPHQVFRAASDLRDGAGNVLVTAYALKRPDGQWSVLLINKGRENAHEVNVVFKNSDSRSSWMFAGPVEQVSFGSDQFKWRANGAAGYADPAGPPVRSTAGGGPEVSYELPKASITILRGRLRGM